MPYHKDKQQAFQDAQKSFDQAQLASNMIVKDSGSYGAQLSHLKNEVNEAFQQIENAMEVASEHQKAQLQRFQSDLQGLVQEVNDYQE
ncbi:hypothetical protein [Falsibacillus pallidus]|uniref:Small, acid-soluble spore protein N n=1 Tax=Falsibacillus pallidus TaxID=493781 RepID=A0A370GQ45_9BACI|nr:hypothetical protein [Falsibacillus pallidus]RDI45832.1 hypothetical protein DFR59_102467 [Falsibacillus pallidus]